MKLTALLLVALLALATVAAAQTAPDAQGLANDTVHKGKSIVDKAVDGLGAAAKGVGNAAEDAGKGIGAAAGAFGRFFVDVVVALGSGTAFAARLVSTLGIAAADSLASSVTAAMSASGATLAWIGASLSSTLGLIGAGLTTATLWIAGRIMALAALYAGVVETLRPRAMDPVLFDSIAIAGTAASSAAAGYGLWGLARRIGLLGAMPAGLFSRIEDDELLRHPMRAQIFQIVQANPGVHASELARRVGAGWGTIVHHLEKLEKAKLLSVRKVNNQKCFFESGGKVSRLDMQVASAVRGDSASQIASFVTSHPMTSQKSMAGELGISAALASFHVKKLVALGVLDKVRRGKETLLTTTESLRRILAGESAVVTVEGLALAPLNA